MEVGQVSTVWCQAHGLQGSWLFKVADAKARDAGLELPKPPWPKVGVAGRECGEHIGTWDMGGQHSGGLGRGLVLFFPQARQRRLTRGQAASAPREEGTCFGMK